MTKGYAILRTEATIIIIIIIIMIRISITLDLFESHEKNHTQYSDQRTQPFLHNPKDFFTSEIIFTFEYLSPGTNIHQGNTTVHKTNTGNDYLKFC